ncbi:MAG: alpha-1,4-glucan--maltose-1-phosphate maltosyltransferase [Deltaproteobacteria bacterium]|nr:alpha-1,4-glucan--maltose-1-phosphate maltosyltransferase [Deltaproteobacteria bacterium]
MVQSERIITNRVEKIPPSALKHIVIEDISPSVDGGRFPVKRVVGESCAVEADIFRDGHQIIRAAIKYRHKADENFSEAMMTPLGNDRWRGTFVPTDIGRYLYTIESWTDLFASWLSDFSKKAIAGREVRSDLLEGITLIENILRTAAGRDREMLADCVEWLRRSANKVDAALEILSRPEIAAAALRSADRYGVVRFAPLLELVVDRPKARFSAWYEIFARSQGTNQSRPATFREAERCLPDIADMGFDVLYLTPIHPIGVTNRKGANNQVAGAPESPGSPWAIGNSDGGHDAIDPDLGTIGDFDHFVATAKNLGLEPALDFALQCSPDHPWVRDHPQWFNHRPDGTIKYAENPPKEYQDIYPIDFDTADQRGLLQETLRVLRFWIDHGIRIFRVDNPHTKPLSYWGWLIETVQARFPDVIFLSEAFTRPKMMKALAKAGFTQSYTYFTWRNSRSELIDYVTELTQTPMREYYRPNFFTNTPDILPPILQQGGRPAFKMRLVLAATMSSNYGIYQGFELCENEAVPGTEEYLNSEKYEIKVRDRHKPGNIREYVARVNQIRRENPALQEFLNLRFLDTDNEQILLYVKSTADRDNIILVAVNLDPFHSHYCTAFVPPDEVGVTSGQPYRVTDLLTGAIYTWSDRNYVRLDPAIEPAHILRVDQRL